MPDERPEAAPGASDGPGPALLRRIESLVGERAVVARRAPGGYGAAERWIVRFASGASAFAKAGTTVVSSESLRAEHAVYERLTLACMPRAIAWEDDAERPLLLLEDLSSCAWPPPWSAPGVDAVLRAIDDVHLTRAGLAPFEAKHGSDALGPWWDRIERRPEPLVALGVVSRDWLGRSIGALREAAARVSPAGDAVCHFDLRSDNVCLRDGSAVLVDWSHAALGDPRVDLGLFLPGLAAEGGPAPREIMPGAGDVAAWVAGFFAHYASKPVIPSAPSVREMQRVHLRAALAWAAGELGL